jgi:hypothetical protein
MSNGDEVVDNRRVINNYALLNDWPDRPLSFLITGVIAWLFGTFFLQCHVEWVQAIAIIPTIAIMLFLRVF